MTLKNYELTFKMVKTTVEKRTVRTELDSDEIALLAQVHKFEYKEI